MKQEEISELRKNIDNTYGEINDMISFKGIELIDLAYPNHDGNQDADAAAEMMLLRQSANSLKNACEILIKKLTDVIELSK